MQPSGQKGGGPFIRERSGIFGFTRLYEVYEYESQPVTISESGRRTQLSFLQPNQGGMLKFARGWKGGWFLGYLWGVPRDWQ